MNNLYFKYGNKLGCHQRPDRSFYFRGHKFPVCARCTGVIIGQSVAIVFALSKLRLNLWINFLMLFIMFIDWLIQRLNICESTNLRRLFTGIFGGFGYVSILIEIFYQILGLLGL